MHPACSLFGCAGKRKLTIQGPKGKEMLVRNDTGRSGQMLRAVYALKWARKYCNIGIINRELMGNCIPANFALSGEKIPRRRSSCHFLNKACASGKSSRGHTIPAIETAGTSFAGKRFCKERVPSRRAARQCLAPHCAKDNPRMMSQTAGAV